ncbi:unnamed protein product [Diamesa tonsa]
MRGSYKGDSRGYYELHQITPKIKKSKNISIHCAMKTDQQPKRSYVVPKRSWVQKNPRLFQGIFITVSLLAFFSKPIYDGFIKDDYPQLPAPSRK